MRAVQVVDRTGPSGVRVCEVPVPPCGPTDVLVEVRAAGVTFPDLLQSEGRYQERPPLPFTLGGEFAGVVRQAPAGSPYAPGDRVVCSNTHGFAEVAAVPYGRVLPLPASIPFDIGACLPANYLTMLFGLLHRGRLQAGERVLVHGASGGVGIASVQLALALGASQVVAVTSAPLALPPGVDVVAAEGFEGAVADLTSGAGMDLVVDPVGGDRLTRSLACLAPGGRALVVGFAAGTIPTVPADATRDPNIDLIGVGWGSFLAHHPHQLRQEWDRLMVLMRDHRSVRPQIDRTLPLGGAADALRALQHRRARGRWVLCP